MNRDITLDPRSNLFSTESRNKRTAVTADPRLETVSAEKNNRRLAVTQDPRAGLIMKEKDRDLHTGEMIGSGYVISKAMPVQSGQAKLYLCIKEGRTYVLKMYRSGIVPNWQIQNFIKNHICEGLCRIYEFGKHESSWYEIMEYCSGGSLEDCSVMSAKEIRKVLLPGVINGLKALHDHGIVHGDLKPSNILFNADKSKAVIADYGSSCWIDEKTREKQVHPQTLEYAPMASSVSGQVVITSAYDYGSLGLILIRMMTGRSLFAGMAPQEIFVCWKNGLQIPYEVQDQLGPLVKGLLEKDEDQRWNYEKVHHWIQGFERPGLRTGRRTARKSKKKTEIKPLIFRIQNDGEILTCSSLHQLARRMKEDWVQARTVVQQIQTVTFVSQFDSEKAIKIQALSKELDIDSRVFKVLIILDDQDEGIYYESRSYQNFHEYLHALERLQDPAAILILKKGLLTYYLRAMQYDLSLVNRLEEFCRISRFENHRELLAICYALSGSKDLKVQNQTVRSLDDLISAMSDMSIFDMNKLLKQDDFLAWLTRLGYREESERLTRLGG